jgi:REP element-mobilizing transposase RayT
METQEMEFVFNKPRYDYLKERLGDKITFISYYKPTEIDTDENHIRCSLTIKDKYDVLDLFHSGISYGLQIGFGRISE